MTRRSIKFFSMLRLKKMDDQFYVLTPNGLIGPYPSIEVARSIAQPHGYSIGRRVPPDSCCDALVKVAGLELVEDNDG